MADLTQSFADAVRLVNYVWPILILNSEFTNSVWPIQLFVRLLSSETAVYLVYGVGRRAGETSFRFKP